MQLTRRDAQWLFPRHTVKVRARREQGTIAAAPHIVHNAPHLPLHPVKIHCPAPLQRLQQPLDFLSPATAGCQ
jgi:hypothetical protein